jgi:hypothetical protein
MSSGNGNGEDEDSTPPAPMPPSIEKAAIQAILNLSTSLNGYAQRLVSLTRGIHRIGFTPIMDPVLELFAAHLDLRRSFQVGRRLFETG